ncbi:MAG: hypothetical protein Q7R51_01275 [bacterium]|nr:hypothetical protein [bacterium]
MYKNFKACFVFFLLILTTYYLLLTTPKTEAQTMTNNDYIIKTENLNPFSNSTEQSEDSVAKETNPSISEGVNFRVKSGFENIKSSLSFSASLSTDLIDFGDLSPTNPIIRTVDLSILNPPAYGYSVMASENNPLKSDTTTIPDTNCDNGECNHETSGIWTNTLTYGSGYRCDNLTGSDCDSSFLNPDFYKHFADASNSQSSQSVMSGSGKENKSARLSYKVNIPGSQTQGTYTNIITFIAVPNF